MRENPRIRARPAVALFLIGSMLVAPEALAADSTSPWSIGLVTSMLALSLGACSAILGMWVGRDRKRPILFAFAMTVLIATAVGVGIVQSYLDAVDGVQKRADLARMMDMVQEIAIKSGDHELAALIEAEGGGVVEIPPPPDEPPPEAADDTAPTEDPVPQEEAPDQGSEDAP